MFAKINPSTNMPTTIVLCFQRQFGVTAVSDNKRVIKSARVVFVFSVSNHDKPRLKL